MLPPRDAPPRQLDSYGPPPEWVHSHPYPRSQTHSHSYPHPHPYPHRDLTSQSGVAASNPPAFAPRPVGYAPLPTYAASEPAQGVPLGRFTFSIPPAPALASTPVPGPSFDGYYLPRAPTVTDFDPDLYTLRSIQRQRKREFSNSSPSSVTSTVAPSTLLGFAGGTETPSHSNSTSTSAEPSPPLHYPTPHRGPFEYFQPFPSSSDSTSTPFQWTEPHPVPHPARPILDAPPAPSSYPVVPLPFSFSFPSSSSFSSAEPPPPLPLASPQPPFPAPDRPFPLDPPLSTQTTTLANPTSTQPPAVLTTLSSSSIDPTTLTTRPDLLLPILAKGLEIRRRHYTELPNPLSTNPARNKSRSSTSPPPPLLPMLGGKGSRTTRTKMTKRTNSRSGPLPSGDNDRDDGAHDDDNDEDDVVVDEENGRGGRGWNGRVWRIGKNASGKKITSLEVRVTCCGRSSEGHRSQQRGGGGGGEGGGDHGGGRHARPVRGRDGEEGDWVESTREADDNRGCRTNDVARVVLRNLGTRLLDALHAIDERERSRGDEAERPGGGRGKARTGYRSRSATTSVGSSSNNTTPTFSNVSTFPPPRLDSTAAASWSNLPAELGIELNGSSCLVCAGLAPVTSNTTAPMTTTATNEADRVRERGYEDTLSAAIDRFEQLSLVGDGHGRVKREILDDLVPPFQRPCAANDRDQREEKQDWERLVHLEPEQVPHDFARRILKCDVCNLVCGLSSIEYTDPPALSTVHDNVANGHGKGDRAGPRSQTTTTTGARAFTVEVICARCDHLFKACSDCGGGGGRLSAGRWRCRELFPDGRKNCQLSHARNPTLNEISIVVSPVSTLSPTELDEAASECRKLFFNTRLGTLCRPEFMLKGDGLANSFQQAENLSIDYWGRLEDTLRGELPPDSPMKRYLVITYSQRRPRHPPKSSAAAKEEVGQDDNFDYEYDLGEPRPAPHPKSTRQPGATGASKMTPWAFSIVEVDFSVGVLFFCCVIPWATSGQSFDANSLLIERINLRVKSDLAELNRARLTPFPPVRYNFIVSPFRLDSKNSQNLNRRGFYTLDQLDEIEDANDRVDRNLFPPHRPIWLPAHYAKAMHVFVRKLENDQDLGGPPPQNAPRKRKKKLNAAL